MSGQILTIAGAMFMIPLLIMVAFALVTDVPGPLFILRRMDHGVQPDRGSNRGVHRHERGMRSQRHE